MVGKRQKPPCKQNARSVRTKHHKQFATKHDSGIGPMCTFRLTLQRNNLKNRQPVLKNSAITIRVITPIGLHLQNQATSPQTLFLCGLETYIEKASAYHPIDLFD
jgi:hypothetical protein